MNIGKRTALCCALAGLGGAAGAGERDWLQVDLSLKYAQKYISLGRDYNEGDATVHPEVYAGLGDTGLYLGVWGALGAESRNYWAEWDEYDFYLGYADTLFPGKRYALEYGLAYTFLYFPRIKSSLGDQDYHEGVLSARFPELFPKAGNAGLTPYAKLYTDRAVTRAHRDTVDQTVFNLGLDYAFSRRAGEDYAWYVETYYNDGGREGTDPGWSHLATGLRASFEWQGFKLSPTLNYQWSWEDTVNSENDFWFTFQVSRHLGN